MVGILLGFPQQSGKHNSLIPQILAMHAISGCDKVAAYYGIGKSKAVASSKKGFVLDCCGIIDTLWDNVEKEETKFMIAAYDRIGASISECHQCRWALMAAKSSGAPKLCSAGAIPSDTTMLQWNLTLLHLIYRNVLSPIPLVEGVCLPPDFVLIPCGCDSHSSCRMSKCGCTGLPNALHYNVCLLGWGFMFEQIHNCQGL